MQQPFSPTGCPGCPPACSSQTAQMQAVRAHPGRVKGDDINVCSGELQRCPGATERGQAATRGALAHAHHPQHLLSIHKCIHCLSVSLSSHTTAMGEEGAEAIRHPARDGRVAVVAGPPAGTACCGRQPGAACRAARSSCIGHWQGSPPPHACTHTPHLCQGAGGRGSVAKRRPGVQQGRGCVCGIDKAVQEDHLGRLAAPLCCCSMRARGGEGGPAADHGNSAPAGAPTTRSPEALLMHHCASSHAPPTPASSPEKTSTTSAGSARTMVTCGWVLTVQLVS